LEQALLLLAVLFAGVSGHPAQFVDYDDDNVVWAASNFSSSLTTHLAPYQKTSVDSILSGQVQSVNGINVIMALAIKEEMTFDDKRKRHGWPAHQLHYVEMTHAGSWMPEHSWQVVKDVIPPKQMFLDPTADDGIQRIHKYAEQCVRHLNDVVLPKEIEKIHHHGNGEWLNLEDYKQEVVEYLRADVQNFDLIDIAMNMTRLKDKHVELVDVIFISRCKSCDNKEKKHIGVGLVGRNKDGNLEVLSVFNEAMYKMQKEGQDGGSDKEEEEEKDEDVDCDDKGGGMRPGSVFALVFFLSGTVGVVSFIMGKRKGWMSSNRTRVPTLDEFNESSTEMTGWGSGSGMDMRPIEKEGIVSANDIDMEETTL